MSDETNKDIPGLDSRVIKLTFTDSTIDNVHYKMIHIDRWEELEKELKELRHFKDSNTGLWATDQDPNNIINKATKDDVKWNYRFETANEEFLAEQLVSNIQEEFKKIIFQIK